MRASTSKLSPEVPKWLKTVSGGANIVVFPAVISNNTTSVMAIASVVAKAATKNPTSE